MLTSPLPSPQGGGDFADLWELVNVAEESRPLVLAWLLASLLDVSHPIMALLGLHGTGKTTAARFIASVIDPSTAAVRAVPRDLDGWAVAASGLAAERGLGLHRRYLVDQGALPASWRPGPPARCA